MGLNRLPIKIGKKLNEDTHDMVHLKKKENFIINGLKKDVIVRQKKYSGDLIEHRMIRDQHQCFVLDLEAKDL